MAFDLAGWNDGLSYSLVDNCNAEKFDYIRTGDDSIINAVSIFSFIILKDYSTNFEKCYILYEGAEMEKRLFVKAFMGLLL